MNEELQKALEEFLNMILEAKDFALEQLPDVLQQLVIMSIIQSYVFISILLQQHRERLEGVIKK